MKKTLILFKLFFLSYLAIAQNSIIWSVSKPGNDKTSYILGTFHQMGNSFIDEKPLIIELLSKSDLVIFESAEDPQKNIIEVLL